MDSLNACGCNVSVFGFLDVGCQGRVKAEMTTNWASVIELDVWRTSRRASVAPSRPACCDPNPANSQMALCAQLSSYLL